MKKNYVFPPGVVAFAALLALTCMLSSSRICWSGGHPSSAGAYKIVIHKSKQLLELRENGVRVKSYRVVLGIAPEGRKSLVGDKKTPEGNYYICMKSASSRFRISYPGEDDAQYAFEKGLISLDTRDAIISKIREGKPPPWNTKLGGWVGIHGYPSNEYQRRWVALLYPKPHNWTDGCIALWNFEIEELFATVPLGTPVTILP
ncbi:MAG: L,D-transpeptidase [Deltaproteobacteria bacterium]